MIQTSGSRGDWEISRWAEYRVLCANGQYKHTLDKPTVRGHVLTMVEGYDSRPCGPHRIEQRTCERATSPWGALLDTDPQTQSRDAVFQLAQMHVCPKCGAEIGEACFNLTTFRSKGVKEPTAWPHTERIDVGLN